MVGIPADDVFSSRRIDSKLPKHQANYAKEMMAEEERLQRLLFCTRKITGKICLCLGFYPLANEGLIGWLGFLTKKQWNVIVGGVEPNPCAKFC